MKNITGAQGAFIARLLIESYQAKAHRILEAGYTGQKKDKRGHTRYYANGRQVKNPNATEKAAIHAAAGQSLPAGQSTSHNDAATKVDALDPATPPEHVAALANDLMKMSVADLTKMAQGPAKSTPPSPQQQMLNSVGSSGKADGKRTLEKTGKLPHELTLNEFAAVVDPDNAKWQNKEDPSEEHLAWVKAAMVHEPEKVPASVLQMYADKDASISNELQSRSADKPSAPPAPEPEAPAATAPPTPTAGMSADANALDALRLKSNKKTHNPAHINPEALSSLKAQGFIDDKNKLTNEGRAHLYAEKLKGAPAPTGTAAATPAAPKPKWKRANRNKDSLISIVKRKGGINSKSLKKDYDYQADIIEGGLLHAIRKQGMGLDEMAASLQVEGHIIVPEGVDPGDYLLDRMKGRHHSALRNTDKEIESEEQAYYKAKQQVEEEGHNEREIESIRRSSVQAGESAGQKEGATELDEWDNSGAGETGSGEKSGTVSGDGYDSADTDDYDRNAGQDGPVDNSFDFGANADEKPKADEPTPDEAPAPAAPAAAPPPDDAVARHMQRQAFTGVDSQGRQWQNGELVAAKDDEPAAPAGKAEPEPEPKANEKEQPETIGKGSTGDVTKQGDQVYKTANENESNAYSKLAGIDGVAPGKLEGDKIVTPFYKHVISVDTIPYEKRQTLGPILKPNLGRMVNAVTALSDEGLSYNDPLQFGFDKDKKSNLLDFSMAEKVDNAPRENLSALANYLKQFGLSKHGDAMTQVALVSDYITPGSRWLDDDSTDSIDGAKIEANLDGKPGKYAYYSFNARTIPGVAQTGHRDAANVIFSDKPLSNEFMETWEIHPAIHRTDAKTDEPEPKAAPEPDKKSNKFENPGDVITPSSQSRTGENPLEVVSIKDGWALVGYANRPDGPRVRMPSESLDLFRQDQQGRVDLPDHTGNEAIDKISNGKGKLLGSGDDGLAYDAGDKVVKVSTTAPFHAFGHEHRAPAEAVHRLKGQAEINNDMIKAGVPGLLPQTFEEHGNRGFITMEKLDTTTKLTPEQVDEVARNLEAMHKLGYVLGDQIQVGIDFAGHPKIFDTGKAVKAGSGGYSKEDHIDYDNSNLERFFKDNGLTYEDPEQKKLTKLRDSTRAQIEKIKAAPKDIDQGKAQFLLHSFSLHLNLLAHQTGGVLYAYAMADDPDVKKLELIARHTIDTDSFHDKTVKKLKPMDAPAAAAPDQPGFTGTDAHGREWQNGELAAQQAPPPMDEETYLATNGASRQGIGEPALHRQPRAKPNQIEKNANRQLEKDYELTGRRDDLRKEYADKVASGEIRPPTRTEKLIQSANGHEDNESTQAARRILQKSGIDWNQPAPPPNPGEADTPPAAPAPYETAAEQAERVGVQFWARRKFKNTEHAINFANWFKGSKVKNENGEPLVVYHGASEDFDTFSNQKSRTGDSTEGFWMASNPDEANEYSFSKGTYKGIIKPTYLKVKNPYIVDAKGKEHYDPLLNKQAIEEAKKGGHDGVIIKNYSPAGHKGDYYFVFSPNQIKSATGNRGTYDPNSPKTTEATMPTNDKAQKIKLVQAIIARRGIKPPQPKAQAKKTPEASGDADPRVKRIRELMDAYC